MSGTSRRAGLANYVQVGVVRGGGAAIELIFVILAGRALGLIETGSFFTAYTIFLVVVAVARGGFDYVLVRDIADVRTRGQDDELHGRVTAGFVLVGVLSTIAGSGLWLFSTVFAEVIFPEATAQVLGLLALAVPSFALTYLGAEIFKGFERIQLSQLLYSWLLLPPAMCFVMWSDVDSAVELAWTIVWTAALVACGVWVGVVILLGRRVRGTPRWIEPDPGSIGSMFFVRPVALAANSMPIWMLSALADPAQAGAYAIANRLAMAISLASVAVDAVSAPRFSRERNETNGESRRVGLRRTQALSLYMSIGIAIPLIIAAPWILSAMGEAFMREGYLLLAILSLAYVVNGYFAPIGTFALMTGFERSALSIYIFALVGTILGVWASLYSSSTWSTAAVMIVIFTGRGVFLNARLKFSDAQAKEPGA